MLREKNLKPKRRGCNTWEDKIILVNGLPIETVPIRQSMIHYDNWILANLAIHVVVQAVQDWNKLNKHGRKEMVKAENKCVFIFREEVAVFFNSTFFGNILEVILPDLTQEEAVKHMDTLLLKDQQIALGRGKNFYSGRKKSDSKNFLKENNYGYQKTR